MPPGTETSLLPLPKEISVLKLIIEKSIPHRNLNHGCLPLFVLVFSSMLLLGMP